MILGPDNGVRLAIGERAMGRIGVWVASGSVPGRMKKKTHGWQGEPTSISIGVCPQSVWGLSPGASTVKKKTHGWQGEPTDVLLLPIRGFALLSVGLVR